jgi:hypothetical protein
MWEPRPLATLWASTARSRDIFTYNNVNYSPKHYYYYYYYYYYQSYLYTVNYLYYYYYYLNLLKIRCIILALLLCVSCLYFFNILTL